MKRCTAFLLMVILLASSLIIFDPENEFVDADLLDESALGTRGPILIEGDSNFTLANGVSWGNGSFDNPYIIENWSISAETAHGIKVTLTSSHFIIRNCLVKDGCVKEVRYNSGIFFENVQNGSIINCSISENGGAILGSNCVNIQVLNNTFNTNGVGFRSYSRDISIRNNTFQEGSIGISYLSRYININNNSRIGEEPFSISISGSEQCNVENNTCSVIDLRDSDHCVVKDNNITVIQYWGMEIYGSDNNLISNNWIEIPLSEIGPRGPSALQIIRSRSNNFSRNTIVNGGVSYYGQDVEDYSSNMIDISNTFNGKPPLFLVDRSTPGEWSSGYGIFILVNCVDQKIRGLDLSGVSRGILAAYSRNITVSDCVFSDVAYGIWIVESEGIEIYNVTVDNCIWGVETDESQFIRIHNCSFADSLYGIHLYSSSHAVVIDNEAHSSNSGIRIYAESRKGENITVSRNILTNNIRGLETFYRTSVFNNSIDSNSECGILVLRSSNLIIHNRIMNNGIGVQFKEYGGGNTITDNMILSNGIGIQLNVDFQNNFILGNEISQSTGYAIEITDWRVRNNVILNNSFDNNNGGGIQAKDEGEFTKWDNGTGSGNYWGDYQSRYVPPATNDGTFWDTPYVVNGTQGNQDNYPLVYSRINTQKVLKLSTQNQVEAAVDRDYSVNYWVAYTGGDPNNIVWSFSSNASWLTFGQNHSLKGKPTSTNIGSYWVNISVTDGTLSDHMNFTLTVSVMNFPPEITTNNVEIIDQWTDYWIDYNATDENERLLVWNLITNASFLHINNKTGVLSGTPGLNDTGVFYVNVSVSDGVYLTDHWFDLTVIDVNDPPMQNSSISQFLMIEDDILTYSVSELFFNYDEDPLNISIHYNVNISATINETGMLFLVPQTDWFGNETLAFDVSDGHYNLTFEIKIIVLNVNDVPRGLVIHFAHTALFEGDNQTIYASFFDPDLNDPANITWIVEKIGIIGYGLSMNMSLSAGYYNLTLRIMDSSGNYTEITVPLVVQRRIEDLPPVKDPRFPWELVIILAIVMISMIGALLFIIKKRTNRSDDSNVDESDLAPLLSMKGSMRPGGSVEPSFEVGKAGLEMEHNDITEKMIDDIPWIDSVNEKIKQPMEQALNDEIVPYHDLDLNSIERGLERKRKDGNLTDDEYLHLRSFMDEIIEE